MIDLVNLNLKAGDGGDGRISLHREKYRPKGGPDGGNGGRGGNIILKGNKNLNTLRNFAGVKQYLAQNGQAGGKNKQHGFQGKDLVLEVPLGTVVWLAAENETSRFRRKKFQKPLVNFELEDQADGTEDEIEISSSSTTQEHDFFRLNSLLVRDDLTFHKYYQDWGEHQADPKPTDSLQLIDPQQEDAEIKEFTDLDQILDSNFLKFNKSNKLATVKLAEIREHDQTLVVCQGGFGGRGNHSFRGPSHQTPLEAEYGTYGEKKEVILELRLLADLGLVGLPNAGKSTLLSRLTKAHPKIADYPFTTLEPNLGVLVGEKGKKELVVADIPGLIEGASLGKGLGSKFLRHIENCRILLYVLFWEEHLVFDEEISLEDKSEQLWQQYQRLSQELKAHHEFLLKKPFLVSLNKIDIYPPELVESAQERFKKEGEVLLSFSGVTGEGLDEIKKEIFQKN